MVARLKLKDIDGRAPPGVKQVLRLGQIGRGLSQSTPRVRLPGGSDDQPGADRTICSNCWNTPRCFDTPSVVERHGVKVTIRIAPLEDEPATVHLTATMVGGSEIRRA